MLKQPAEIEIALLDPFSQNEMRSPGLHPAYWVEDPGLRPQNVTEYLSTRRERMLQAGGPRPQSFLGLLPVITTDSAPKVFVRRPQNVT